MADCILGIRCNGVSIKIDTLQFESDQSEYDYICNVNLSSSSNGNGTYNISIVNKDLAQGFPIGKWRITKAYIAFDWGKSVAKFIITDENGNETKPLTASQQRGTASSEGFNTNSLARSIFAKAQMVISEYPSAAICDAVIEFDEQSSDYTWRYIKESFSKGGRNAEQYIELIGYLSKKVAEYTNSYKRLKEILELNDDPKAKQLLIKINNDCRNVLQELPFKPFNISA